MQGYIISLRKVRDEDLIVSILCENHIYKAYRFYGARHSIVNIGHKIDFELEHNLKSDIPRLKDVLQLNFSWNMDGNKLYAWQRFIKLFYPHLKDVEEIDSFYFKLLDEIAHKMCKQNAKRAILENYIKLLEHEGRLHLDFTCLLCDIKIDSRATLVRSFLPTHASCSFGKAFEIDRLKEFFKEKTLLSFEDNEVEHLWNTLLQGL